MGRYVDVSTVLFSYEDFSMLIYIFTLEGILVPKSGKYVIRQMFALDSECTEGLFYFCLAQSKADKN